MLSLQLLHYNNNIIIYKRSGLSRKKVQLYFYINVKYSALIILYYNINFQ